MSEELRESLAVYFQRMLPLLVSIILVLMSFVPLNFDAASVLRPDVGLICVFFWMIHRPDVFNLFSVYFVGLVEDIVTSAPFGSNIFACLVMYLLVSNLAVYLNAKPFVVTWYGFALMALVTMFSRWLLVSVYYSQFLPLSLMMFSLLFTIALYPVVSLVNAFVQNALMKDEA